MIWTDENIRKARESMEAWRGTPYGKCRRERGAGVDCVNFVVSVLVESGLMADIKLRFYPSWIGMHDPKDTLGRVIEESCYVRRVDRDEPKEFGDILTFRTRPHSNHLAIFDGEYVWHALAGRSVQKNPLDDWERKIRSWFRLERAEWKNHPMNVLRS